MKKRIAFIALFLVAIVSNAQTEENPFSDRMDAIESKAREGDFDTAMDMAFETLELIEYNSKGDSTMALEKAILYREIANIYSVTSDSMAIVHNKIARKYAYISKDPKRIFDIYSKDFFIGIYYPQSTAPELLNEYADSCLKYAVLSGNVSDHFEAYSFKFRALMNLENVVSANAYLDSANQMLPFITDGVSIADFYRVVGATHRVYGKTEEAKRYFQKALQKTKELGMENGYIDALFNLAFINHELGNYEESVQYFMEYADTNQVFQRNIMERRFSEANARFNVAKKDKEIAEKNEQIAENKLALAKEREWTSYLIFGSIVLFLVIAALFQYFYFKQRKIAHRKDLELQKEQEFNDLRTEFLENIAHEIRTPLTLINGYLTLARDKVSEDKKAVDHIQKAMQGSEKVLENAGEILELLKFEKGKLPLAKNQISLNDFLRRVFYSFDSLAQLKELDLKYFSDIDADVVIESDESRMEKILNNLLSNAIKFSPRNGTIEMVVETKNDILSLKLVDQGPGIPMNEQEAIFKRFYQSKSTNSVGGVGVGLSLARDFAHSMKGDLTVQSTTGSGSAFLWTMPMKVIAEVNSTVAANKQETFERSNQLNIHNLPEIMVVEDNPEMSAYLVEILSGQFQVDHAFDGAEAIEMINEKKYKLIISDVMMPKVDGFELREHVRKRQNYTNVPFIFLTAKSSLDDRLKGFRLGADEYLAKPFSQEELLMRIQNILQTKSEREKWVNDNLEFLGEKDQTAEEALMDKINSLIKERLTEDHFSIPDLATEVGYSQRQLARIIKKQMGVSPVQYVLEIRLQMAYTLLVEKRFNSLAEVRYKVGINSASHFNTKFKERFGIKPSEV